MVFSATNPHFAGGATGGGVGAGAGGVGVDSHSPRSTVRLLPFSAEGNGANSIVPTKFFGKVYKKAPSAVFWTDIGFTLPNSVDSGIASARAETSNPGFDVEPAVMTLQFAPGMKPGELHPGSRWVQSMVASHAVEVVT